MKRALIVRTDKLGDVIQTLPMARELKRLRPDVHLAMMVQPYTAPLFELVPYVDEVIISTRTAKVRERLATFKRANADAVFFPAARFSEATAAFVARIKTRVGTGYRWYSPLYSHRVFDHRREGHFHESVYNLRLLRTVGIEPDYSALPLLVLRHEDERRAEEALAQVPGKFTILHVASGGSSPRWPIQRFVDFGEWVAQRLTTSVVLTGTAQEREQLFSVRDQLGTRGVRTETLMNLSLPTLAAVLSRASLVVASSTGPGHLAAAVGAPTIGLFPLATGLTEKRWGFKGISVANLSPQSQVEGCPDCRQCTCLERISLDDVKAQALQFQ